MKPNRCIIHSWLLIALALSTTMLTGEVKGDQTSDVTRIEPKTVAGKLTVETDPQKVAKVLADRDVWLMPQPKTVALTDESFDLKQCMGIRTVGLSGTEKSLLGDTAAFIKDHSGVELKPVFGKAVERCIILELCTNGKPTEVAGSISASELKDLGDQGYVLHVDRRGISAAATGLTGLYYASLTLAQIAADRTVLPGLHIRDWPSMTYRGIQYDMSRGQIPTEQTFKHLTRNIAEAKMNIMELYIEDTFKWQKHPDISSPMAITPNAAHELFNYAARYHVEVHPMLQVLGHFYKIGSKPSCKDLMVSGGQTVDIRKPEAVQFVRDLITETSKAFPGKFLNVDITEIDDSLFLNTGTSQDELTKLILDYVIKLRDTIKPYNTRLMIAQSQLSSAGMLNGIGAVIDRLPKDILISSYYTTEFYGGWDKDFPRLNDLGVQFFAQSWIDSHAHIMPYVGHAMDFSDITVSRGLQYGALGSTTCDWGDMGHYHFAGTTWYPFLYHGVSAWTGAKLDRDYFNKAYCHLIFGAKDDSIAKAINLAGNINGQPMKIRTESGDTSIPAYSGNSTFGRYYNEFFSDPFVDTKITEIVDPLQKGKEILAPADEAVTLLSAALCQAPRNRNNIEQLLFAARNYQAMGRKLIMRAHYMDPQFPREKVASELQDLVTTYNELKADFQRIWLAEDKDNDGYRELVQRFDNAILVLKKKADEIK